MTFNDKLETSYKKNRKKWVNQLKGGDVTQEMAEDAVQLACVNALVHQESYDMNRDFDSWFGWVLNNALKSVMKHERRGGMVGRSL